MHLFFTLLTLCLVVAIAWNAWQYYQYGRIARAIESIPDAIPASVQEDANKQTQFLHPAVKLARASALSRGDQFDAAELLFVEIIDSQQYQSLGQAARFNLANHYLRQGARTDLPGAQTRPLLEMAKQRYRDLLQVHPMDWDARYNLERALALAPERINADPEHGPPPKSVRVIVPDFEADNLP